MSKPVPYHPYGDYFKIEKSGRVFRPESHITIYRGDTVFERHVPHRELQLRTNGILPYLFVDLVLRIDGIGYRKSAYVHKMIAELWLPNPEGFPLVTFIDGDPTNIALDNLMWTHQSHISSRTMEMHPEMRNNLRDANIKSGYYKKKRRIRVKN